jgi:hypothetical protein
MHQRPPANGSAAGGGPRLASAGAYKHRNVLFLDEILKFETLALSAAALLLFCGATAANGQSKKHSRPEGDSFLRGSASISQAQALGAPAAPMLFAAAAPHDPDAGRKLSNAATAIVAKRKVQPLHSLTPEVLAGQGQTQLQRQPSAAASPKIAEPSTKASSSSAFADVSDPAYIQRVWRARR